MGKVSKQYIDLRQRPGDFAESRWLGIEDALDFAGELLFTHQFLVVGCFYAFGHATTIQALEHATQQF